LSFSLFTAVQFLTGACMIDLENYVEHGTPEQKELGNYWRTAIGLQQVDGLKPSKFLISLANRNINGEITIEEVQKLIDEYYKVKKSK
jgi:hypothetical protein